MERTRPREQMVQVFWNDLHDRTWLFFNVELELMVERDAEMPDEVYYRHLCDIRRSMALNDYAEIKRSIVEAAAHLGVELNDTEIV